MSNQKTLLNEIFKAMNEVNQQIDTKLSIVENEIIFGTKSKLDSLGLINLMVTLEDQLRSVFPNVEFELNLPEFIEPLIEQEANVLKLAAAIENKYLTK